MYLATVEQGRRTSHAKAAEDPPEFASELKRTARQLALQGKWDEARSLYYYVVELSERLFGPTSPEGEAARKMFEPLYSTDKAKG